ncbi:hypothetical protein HJW78_11395 [Klebsiella pneumoniae]|nr:hypothetical protein HJW78_11395 [Klebsiella pneumoniae]
MVVVINEYYALPAIELRDNQAANQDYGLWAMVNLSDDIDETIMSARPPNEPR